MKERSDSETPGLLGSFGTRRRSR